MPSVPSIRIRPKLLCLRSTRAEMQSMREKDFESFASTGVNTPGTMFPAKQRYWRIICPMDAKRDQLETRVATLELMLVTERARPKPDNNELARLEKDLRDAKSALQMYNKEHA